MVLYIIWIDTRPLSVGCFVCIFFPSVIWFFFNFIDDVFLTPEILKFLFFFLIVCAFDSIPKKLVPNVGSQGFNSYVFFEEFYDFLSYIEVKPVVG